MLGSLILYLKGMRIVMFQLSGFYYITVQYMRVPKRFIRFLSGFVEPPQGGLANLGCLPMLCHLAQRPCYLLCIVPDQGISALTMGLQLLADFSLQHDKHRESPYMCTPCYT